MAVELLKVREAFLGTGAPANYTPGIYARTADQIKVYEDGVLQAEGVDYTIDGLGNALAGVAVHGTFVNGATVVVKRETTLKQQAETVNNQTILEDVLDDALDKSMMVDQELDARVDDLEAADIAFDIQLANLLATVSAITAGIVVDTALIVRPESYASPAQLAIDATAAMRLAMGAAAAVGARVRLSANQTYVITSEVVQPEGVVIDGPRSAELKFQNQETAVTTSAITVGIGAKTFTVDDATGFSVGDSVMIFTGGVISPNDPFSHAGRQISAIVGNSITIAAGPNVQAHAIGATLATTTHLLRPQRNTQVRGITINGNAANNLYAHWITSAAIAGEGDGVYLVDVAFKDTPSDAFLYGGPNAGEIKGCWAINCEFDNIGGNGIHYGNCRNLFVFGNRMKLGNVRWNLPVNQGGGNSIRDGHQDGAIIFSNSCYDLTVVGNHVEDWICGVGALGSTAGNINDHVTVIGNAFIDCFAPLEANQHSMAINFSNNRCRATVPGGGMRWNQSKIFVSGDHLIGRCQKISICNNINKNVGIYVDRVLMGSISNNVLDMRELSDGSADPSRYCIQLFNYSGLTVKSNVTNGGFVSLWLQNSIAGGDFGRDAIIEGNIFLNAYRWGLTGILGAGATLAGTILRGNIFRQDNAAKKEDDVTALPFNAADWISITPITGLQIDDNRIAWNHAGGAAWTAFDDATWQNRKGNWINGVREAPLEYADDAAAAAGNSPIGSIYRTGSTVKQRIA